jgi:hypothetical protein
LRASIYIPTASVQSLNHCFILSQFVYVATANAAINAINIVIGHHTAMNANFTAVSQAIRLVNQVIIVGIASHSVHKTVTNHVTATAHIIRFFVNSGFFCIHSLNFSTIGHTVCNNCFFIGSN